MIDTLIDTLNGLAWWQLIIVGLLAWWSAMLLLEATVASISRGWHGGMIDALPEPPEHVEVKTFGTQPAPWCADRDCPREHRIDTPCEKRA